MPVPCLAQCSATDLLGVAHRRLGRVVGRHVVPGDDAGHGRDVDDRPAAGGPEVRQRQLAAQEHAVEVDGVHAPPGLQVGVLDGATLGDAGVVDQDVEPPEFGDRAFQGHAPVRRLGHVVANRDGGAGCLPRYRVGGLARGARVDVGDRDPRALARQQLGNRPPQPRAATGHQRDLAHNPSRRRAHTPSPQIRTGGAGPRGGRPRAGRRDGTAALRWRRRRRTECPGAGRLRSNAVAPTWPARRSR